MVWIFRRQQSVLDVHMAQHVKMETLKPKKTFGVATLHPHYQLSWSFIPVHWNTANLQLVPVLPLLMVVMAAGQEFYAANALKVSAKTYIPLLVERKKNAMIIGFGLRA